MTTTIGISPAETVERALAAARSDDCVVIAEETSAANLRWAGNTLTTNGVSRSRQFTVIAIDRRGDGAAAGVVSRSGVRPDQIGAVVREAEHAAAEAAPAKDAEELIGAGQPGSFGGNEETGRDQPGSSGREKTSEPGWDSPPGHTEIGVLRDFAATLGQTLRAAGAAGRKLYGFAEHELTSTFLGTSTGLRRRQDQPTGRVELNAKSADMVCSAWTGVATRDFSDVDIVGLDAGLTERLGWAERTVSLPAGRYETLLPPTAVSETNEQKRERLPSIFSIYHRPFARLRRLVNDVICKTDKIRTAWAAGDRIGALRAFALGESFGRCLRVTLGATRKALLQTPAALFRSYIQLCHVVAYAYPPPSRLHRTLPALAHLNVIQ